MGKPNITYEKRICLHCHKEYDAEITSLYSIKTCLRGNYCPECHANLITIPTEEPEETQAERLTRTRREMRENCGIPSRFMGEDFSTFKKGKQDKAFQKCWNYAENFPLTAPQGYPSLVLFSEYSWGIGKTHLVCAIGHRLLDQWKGEKIGRPIIKFISEPDLYLQIQATYNYSSEEKLRRESEASIIQSLLQPCLLIIDDVGKRKVQDGRFVQRIMFAIIDGRYKAQLPVVLTANLGQDGLRSYLGGGEDEASFDRLVEMCGGKSGKTIKFFRLEGPSYRRIGLEKKEV